MTELRHVTFRVEHDCALARLSREVGALNVWSGHRLEIILVERTDDAARAAIERFLDPLHILRLPDGLLVVWRPKKSPGSISRILEKHGQMWLQPLRAVDGWEHYDAIAFGDEQAALDELRATHNTQVARRRTIGAEDIAASLFQSLQPALDAPTEKQVEALLAAGREGYYQSPRGSTTAKVAAVVGIGRSAFEERLRGGENRLMEAVLPALAVHRQR